MKCSECQAENPDQSKFCNECGKDFGTIDSGKKTDVSLTKTLEMTTDELSRGTLFADRYEVIEELGTGGMGMVYRVYDKKIEEEVVLKLLKHEISSNKKTIERFKDEIRIARKISHRNVCRMHDLNEESGTQYITMEYVPGEDLKSFIRRAKHLPVGTALSIAKQICDGLSEAHSLGIIHRDLKPQNIMIDRDGNAKIMDVGIARSLTAKGITGEGAIIGTPEYMSPEQVEAKETDQRSDIYSLGVVLFEMVTGRVPFEGDTPLSVAVKQKSEVPPEPAKFNAQIPDALNELVLRCMEKDRADRTQSVEAIYSELEKIEQGIPSAERVTPKRKTLTSKEFTVTFGFKKILVVSLIMAALAIVAIGIWQLLPKTEPTPLQSDKPTVAVLYFLNDTGDESLDVYKKNLCS